MSWIDTIVIVVIVIVGLVIFYKGLKEPLDLIFGLIGRGIKGIAGKISDSKDSAQEGYEVIRYG
jgi:hypothetical protein